MSGNINLSDYEVAKSEIPVNDEVFIKNTEDEDLMAVPLNEVNLYGFEEMEQSEPQPRRTQSGVNIFKIETQPASSIVENDKDPQIKRRIYLQKIFKWDEEKTEFMIDQYKSLSNCVGYYKMFKSKNRLWAHIANKMREKFNVNLTVLQLRTRFACVQKRKQKAKLKEMQNNYDNNSHSTKDPLERRFLKKSNFTKLNQSEVELTPSEGSSSPPMSLIANLVDVDVTSSSVSSPSPSPEPNPNIFKFASDRKSSAGDSTVLQTLMEQINSNFVKYFEMKEKHDKEKLKEKRRYNEEKLKLLRELVRHKNGINQ